jgi:5-methylthioadenosine/S-adenosylhomocysteine deaminase
MGTEAIHPGYGFLAERAAFARAVEDAGLRATIAAPLIDTGSTGVSLKDDARRSLEELAAFGPRIDAALAPHAVYTVTEDGLRWVAEVVADRNLPVHIHLSETEREVDDCLREHAARPAEYLDRLGLLGPRTLLAHGAWLDDAELELVGKRGATVVTNPVANMKLAVGRVFRYPAARRAGIPVGLGTNGPGSNDSLDLLADLKTFALLQKHEAGDPATVPASEAWAVATGARAPLLGASGRLEPGGPADFLVLAADQPELSVGDLTTDLVYSAASSAVDTTVVAGRLLMRGGVVEGAAEVVAKAVERARRLGLA